MSTLGIVDCNLSRMYALRGETSVARDLVERWLVHEELGTAATDMIILCVEAEGGEWLPECDRLASECRASRAMANDLFGFGPNSDPDYVPRSTV